MIIISYLLLVGKGGLECETCWEDNYWHESVSITNQKSSRRVNLSTQRMYILGKNKDFILGMCMREIVIGERVGILLEKVGKW